MIETKTTIAIKEWAAVIRALETGQQAILYRKGGIIEKHDEFEIEAREFYLFPTFLHQDAERLKPEYANLIEEGITAYQPSTEKHQISLFAKIKAISKPSTIEEAVEMTQKGIWNEAHVQRTFEWKPEKPLYILTLEIEKLAEPFIVENKPEYGGCVSWITL